MNQISQSLRDRCHIGYSSGYIYCEWKSSTDYESALRIIYSASYSKFRYIGREYQYDTASGLTNFMNLLKTDLEPYELDFDELENHLELITKSLSLYMWYLDRVDPPKRLVSFVDEWSVKYRQIMNLAPFTKSFPEGRRYYGWDARDADLISLAEFKDMREKGMSDINISRDKPIIVKDKYMDIAEIMLEHLKVLNTMDYYDYVDSLVTKQKSARSVCWKN